MKNTMYPYLLNDKIKNHSLFVLKSLVAEKIGKDTVFEAVLNKLEKELKYWQNYEEYEEKWKKNTKEMRWEF
ncbi:TPA: hypothetical protein R0909_001050 [Campylobacter coli]|nr:hypothetical protein [Campylobacter coli]HEB8312982.1 hypothetical protein [Campylobacter coli]HEB8316255.1 hypothetical protein [Campylobacter coli]HEB8318316.1 hypothetical protein [Campylobacter coli]